MACTPASRSALAKRLQKIEAVQDKFDEADPKTLTKTQIRPAKFSDEGQYVANNLSEVLQPNFCSRRFQRASATTVAQLEKAYEEMSEAYSEKVVSGIKKAQLGNERSTTRI